MTVDHVAELGVEDVRSVKLPPQDLEAADG